jgi:hypothetical protein
MNPEPMQQESVKGAIGFAVICGLSFMLGIWYAHRDGGIDPVSPVSPAPTVVDVVKNVEPKLWHKGPPPSGTYGQGGIVPKDAWDRGIEPIIYASFRGEYAVTVQPISGERKRVDFKDIAFWNDCLQYPPSKHAQ